jgi:HlyD family secretion protein
MVEPLRGDLAPTIVTQPSSIDPASPSPARRRFRPGLVVKIAIPVLLLGAVGSQRQFAPLPARVHHVDRGDVLREVFGRGTIESRREAQLGFDLAGRISDVLVDEGDHVKLGQVIAHLEPQQYQADMRTAASGASVAQAATVRLEAEQRRADVSLAYAEHEEQRSRKLANAGAVSARDLDLAVQQLALARAEVARVQAAQSEGMRSIEVAKGGLAFRKAVATRTALLSPFEGLVIRRFHDPGDPVAVGATVLRVVATDRLWVRAWIDETALGQLAEGQSARVYLPADAEHPIGGRLDRIGREADRQTHEVLVDVLLDAIPDRVAIGQRADVRIELGRVKQALRAPISFIHRDGDNAFCFVDRSGHVAQVAVKIGTVGAGSVEVLAGLRDGDTLLASPKPGASLTAGRRWKVGT